MKLDCYRMHDHAAAIVPARAQRAWMDEAGAGLAQRCTPLTMANSTGWELLCPHGLTASWSGGPAPEDLTIARDAAQDGAPPQLWRASGDGSTLRLGRFGAD